MYLKSLVIQGFKSFAQRVELTFPKGVTAIVGPNGSGKSNVADAIRWVLGEQNIRSLRGSALQDVIFAGTGTRKPLGMAEVSLTLDNSDFTLPLDYTEVTLTRRTYRSGESEFFINRTPCRLRDIQELLMDTGLGRGTLSIIGQGEFDAVLSVRPEERRMLLEDAAGIARYRAKRETALARLAETEADLLRVNDIIAELERQLEPLAREAERAKVYRSLRSELLEAERKILLHEWAVRKEAHRQWDARREAAACELAALREALARTAASRAEAERTVASAQERAAQTAQRLAQLERQAEAHAAGARVLSERLSALRHEAARRAENVSALSAAAEKARDERAHLEEALDQHRAAAEAARRRFEQAEEELAAARARLEEGAAALQALRDQVLSRVRLAADVESELKRMERSYAERAAELEQKKADLAAAQERYDAAAAERAAAEAELAELEKVRSGLAQVVGDMQAGIAKLEAARRTCTESIQALHGRLTKARTQLDALKELEAAYEGFQEGVRACLQAKEPWRERVYGAVGSLLQVLPEHEAALEVALGAAAQNIIVADEATAQAAIEYLKRTRAGRVTFLPLNTLRVPPPLEVDPWLAEDPEYVGIASRLVHFDPAIARAVEYLLGRVLVTRTLAGAIRLNRRHPQINRVVSLDGDLVLAAGPITGGYRARQQGSGLLSRARRLADLAAEVERLGAELEKERAQRDALDRALAEAHKELSAAEGRLQSVLRQAAERQRVCDILRERLQALADEINRIQAGIAKDEELLRRLEAEREAAASRLGSLGTSHGQHDAEVSRLEEELAQLRASCDALEDVRSERRAAWAAASAALERIEAELARADAALRETVRRIADEEAAAAQLAERMAATEREHAAALAAAAACREEAEGVRREAAAAGAELAAARERLEALRQEEAAARSRVDAAAEALHKIELGAERERAAWMQAEERLAERNITPPADPQAVRLDSVEPLRAKAKELRERLEELGDVNVHALDEYAALKERHAFLVAQRDDLVGAKEGLCRAIADLDATSRQRLVATFDAVQAALQQVFPRLFGGGRAELLWTQPDDPLESGIDIVVQPPGKRPQPLLTLSGGERALAAASLLFAIMTVRPSPFFVLDEVDAALDEANVDRFAQLLKEYGAKNQIIVITHRQGTMERADALFGVTMDRGGSSQLVSLKLADALEAAAPERSVGRG